MFRRQKFAVAGVVTKAAAKAAETIKKINKKDMEKFGASFSKMKRMLEKMNQPAVNAYKKTIKQIKSRITKGKSKEDMKDMQDAADILNRKLFRGSKDLVKRYESLPDVRSRFRGAPAFTRACLSFPFEGVKFTTGISIFLSSYVRGKPDAFASTITDSGCQ